MILKNYKYNELAYAEAIFKKGFQTNHFPTEMKLLVLYYKEVLGMKPKERRMQLESFCAKHLDGYKKETRYKDLNRALNAGSKKNNKLVVIPQINICKQEIDYLNSLDVPYNYKKILFAFLVQMKLNKEVYEIKNEKEYTSVFFKGGSQKYGNIHSMANVPAKLKINDEVIYELDKTNIITVLHSGLISLNFLNNCEHDGEPVVTVKDYENVGWYFDYYNNVSGMALCKFCGQPFKQTKKDITYCKAHKEYYVPMETKTIICKDCEKEFEINSLDTKTDRCPECYKIYRSKKNKEAKERWRMKQNS